MIVNCTRKASKDDMNLKPVTVRERIERLLLEAVQADTSDIPAWVASTAQQIHELMGDEASYGRGR